jgi:muramoyltetrapeptide carboxypeptidase
LFFEEVNEAPYRLDRMLTALHLGGHFDVVAGVCVGQLTGCGRDGSSPAALQVVAERLRPLGIPVLSGLPAGHDHPNVPLVLGAKARLTTSPPELHLSPD